MEEPRQSTVFDSEHQHVGTTYAQALVRAGEKAGVSDIVVAELESMVRDVFDRLPKFEAALVSPRIAFEHKELLLDRALSGRAHPLLLNFLKVVARRGRFNCLRAISRAAREEFRRLRGRVEVRVESAQPLDDPTQTLIAQQLCATLGREVDLQLSVSPEIVAGLIIRVGDTVYDGSVSNRLARLRDEIVERSNQKIRSQSDRFARSV